MAKNPLTFQRFVWWTVALLVGLAATLAYYLHVDSAAKRTAQVRLQSMLLAEEMRQSSEELTRMARNFVATGSPEYRQRYQSVLDIRDGRKPRSAKFLARVFNPAVRDSSKEVEMDVAMPLLELMRRTGITPSEFDLLAQAKASSDSLALTEFAAMAVVEKGANNADALSKARATMYDMNYQSAKADIMAAIDAFYVAVDERTTAELTRWDTQANAARTILIFLGLGLVIVLVRANRSINHILGARIETIHAQITQLGQGNFSQNIAVTAGDTESVLARLAQTQKICSPFTKRKEAPTPPATWPCVKQKP